MAASPVVHHGYPAAGDDFAEAVDLSGLTPDTTWWWSLTIEGTTYGPWSFTTPPENSRTRAITSPTGTFSPP